MQLSKFSVFVIKHGFHSDWLTNLIFLRFVEVQTTFDRVQSEWNFASEPK